MNWENSIDMEAVHSGKLLLNTGSPAQCSCDDLQKWDVEEGGASRGKGYIACSVTSVVSDSFATPWTVAHQAPLSRGLSRQEYWSGLLCPPPGILPSD